MVDDVGAYRVETAAAACSAGRALRLSIVTDDMTCFFYANLAELIANEVSCLVPLAVGWVYLQYERDLALLLLRNAAKTTSETKLNSA